MKVFVNMRGLRVSHRQNQGERALHNPEVLQNKEVCKCLQWVGGKRGVIYIKEQFLAPTWLDIQWLNVGWELQKGLDNAAVRFQTLRPGCSSLRHWWQCHHWDLGSGSMHTAIKHPYCVKNNSLSFSRISYWLKEKCLFSIIYYLKKPWCEPNL